MVRASAMREVDGGVRLQAANAVAENRATAATQQQEPGCISCRLTVQCLVIRWTRSTAESAGNIRFQTGDFGSRSRRLTCTSQKNNNPDQLIPGHRGDMSWCTAPAASGSAWGRSALAITAYANMQRMAPSSRRPHRKKSFAGNLYLFVLRRKGVQPSVDDGSSVGPCDLCRDAWPDEALTSETAKVATTTRSNKHISTGGYRWLFMHDILEAAPRWRWLPY
jgi:hypothetical protein